MACFECGRVTDPRSRPGRDAPDGARAARRDSCRRSPHDGKTLIPDEESRAADHPAAGGLPVVRHDGRRHQARHRRRAPAPSTATTSPARPAPPTIITTPGSPASTAIWSPRSGPDSTRTARSATARRARRVSVPTWIYFMHEALAGAPRHMRAGAGRHRHGAHLAGHRPARERRQSERHHGEIHRGQSAARPRSTKARTATNPMNDGDKPLF